MSKELYEMSLEELWTLFPIILSEHNNEWEKWYEEEREQLKTMLSAIQVKRISHIGSTAISEIWAKPIVDILIEISNKEELECVYQILLDKGYLCMDKNQTRLDFNKGYTLYGFAEQVYHIHIRLDGDHDELYFRDYLNDNIEVAKEYEALKISLWKQYQHNRDGYTAAKGEFVHKYTKKGKEVYRDRYE